jgi:hypothetical protein
VWLVQGEVVGPWMMLGGALILLATGVRAVANARA